MKSLATIFSLGLFLFVTFSPFSSIASSDDDECKAWLVQSIPTDMPLLTLVPGVLSTVDVFRWLAGNSTERLDIITQTWQLIAGPNDTRSGDYGYSEEDMEKFGAQDGLSVYQAIENAADRKIKVRLLQHSGVYPDFTKEASDLASGRPNVKNVTLLLDQWWEGGLIHAKVWISDKRHVYIGSANNDWKAFNQMKELGIYLADCKKIAEKVEVYYNNLWMLASLNASENTVTTLDQQWQVNRTVPCWSNVVAPKERCDSPLDDDYVEVKHVPGYPVLSDPSMFKLRLQTPGCFNVSTSLPSFSYLSFSPPELLFDKFQTDEQGWLDTITSVGTGATVRISTMDWLGQSQYTKDPVYWSTLSSAISKVVFSKGATVKLLVVRWAHEVASTDVYLDALLYTNVLCNSASQNHCSGKIEIRYYEVPGFDFTGQALSNGNQTGNLYPGRSRINHAKYAVSDVRAHIGTNNLIWDHMYTTAGVSFGTYNPAIVSQLQQIFDADWNSPYVVSVDPSGEGHTYSS